MHALVVGRFQPLHKGHEALLRAAARQARTLTVAIGSSTAPLDGRNPFSFEERRAMVMAVAPGARVVGVPDLGDPPRWVPHLVSLTGPVDCAFGNDEGTLRLLESQGVPVKRTGFHERGRFEASRVRERLGAGDPGWMEDVPEPVVRLLVSWKAAERIRGLATGSLAGET